MRDGQELLIADGSENIWCDAVAPLRRVLAFLVYSKTFSEPPGHAMICGSEDEHMAHLVPECGAPVKVAWLARRRAIHGNDIAKGDTERTEAWHAHGAHGKI